MRCSSRSTRLFASISLAWLLATTPVFAGAGAVVAPAVVEAIVRAVQLRLGETATVVVASLEGVRLDRSAVSLVAAPEPAARLGGPVRFVLSDVRPGRPSVRAGEAVATLTVSAPVVRAIRAIARGEEVTASDVTVVTAVIGRQPFGPLLTLDDVVGARARRDLSADTTLTRMDLAPSPLVRAGDVVQARARVGNVEIAAEMIAAQSGSRGDVIRVVNQETRHAARARIAARGEVEVVNVR